MPKVMKRWIACLAPWMVLACAASAAKLEPVSVQLTYNSPNTTSGFRVGDQCFIEPSLAKSWQWNVSLNGNEMQVVTEGKLFRVPILREGGKLLMSLTESARFLGALAEWDGDHYRVLGRIRNVEITPEGLQVDSTIKVRPKYLRLTNPDRLVIDFIGGRMDVPENSTLPAWWRIGQFDPSTARVVLEHPGAVAVSAKVSPDTRQLKVPLPSVVSQDPAKITEPIIPVQNTKPNPAGIAAPSFILDQPQIAEDTNASTLLTIKSSKSLTSPPSVQYITPTQLQITLPDAEFRQMTSTQLESSRWITSMQTGSDGRSATLTIVTSRALAFSASTSGNTIRIRVSVPPRSGGLQGKVIVIDPGHGGKDSGARFGNLYEKDIVLPISVRLGELLQSYGASVILTRSTDVYPSLSERPAIANRSQAAAFISIHVNSIAKENGRSGGMTFYHKQDPFDRLLAECIQSEIAKVSKIPDLGTWSDSRIYSSGFKVLRDSTVPSVLIELGFINHKNDRAQLSSKDFTERMAQAILRGVEIFLGNK